VILRRVESNQDKRQSGGKNTRTILSTVFQVNRVLHPIPQQTDDIKYPTWQPECRAVMLEIVPIKVEERLAAAEAAMAKRLPEITTSEGVPERRALKSQGEGFKVSYRCNSKALSEPQ
jgi:hypothetical protein